MFGVGTGEEGGENNFDLKYGGISRIKTTFLLKLFFVEIQTKKMLPRGDQITFLPNFKGFLTQLFTPKYFTNHFDTFLLCKLTLKPQDQL